MDEVPEVADKADAQPLETVEGDVVFEDVSFAYEESTPVLSGVNLKLAPGDKVALFGTSGTGKSTLVHLLSRLYAVPDGTVFIDGVDINRWPLAKLRETIGFVPQEPFLFSDTLAANIAFGFDAPREIEGHPERIAEARELGRRLVEGSA